MIDSKCIYLRSEHRAKRGNLLANNLLTPQIRIIDAIKDCFVIWHQPWKEAYLRDDREFIVVHELMQGLIHYEYQLENENLGPQRIQTISQAVNRLIDYGNAILGLDMIIRTNDSSDWIDIDVDSLTTIELFNHHTKAENLRKKLLYDYFHPKRNSLHPDTSSSGIDASNGQSSPQSTSPVSPVDILEMNFQQQLRLPPIPSPRRIGTQSERPETIQMISNIESKLFSLPHNSSCRINCLPVVLERIHNLLSVRSGESLSNCFAILDSLFNTIEKLESKYRQKEVSLISESLLKLLVHKVLVDNQDELVEYQHSHWTSLFLSLMKMVTPNYLGEFIANFGSSVDLAVFLKDYLFIVQRQVIAGRCGDLSHLSSLNFDDEIAESVNIVFPSHWIEMNLVSTKILLKSLTFLLQTLEAVFVSHSRIWLSHLDCLINFVLQDSLKPNRKTLLARHKTVANELRELTCKQIRTSWDAMQLPMRQKLHEELLEPILTASIHMESRLRCVLLPIVRDMAICSHPPSDSFPYLSDQDSESMDILHKFNCLLIRKLNKLMMTQKLGDKLFGKQIVGAMSNDSDSSDALNGTARIVSKFVRICIDSREAEQLSYGHFYLLCLYKLCEFFKDQKLLPDLYLDTLYRVYLLHHKSSRYVEAGYTLREHASMLAWSRSPLAAEHRLANRYFQVEQSQFADMHSLKEFLYQTIIEYFIKALFYEPAIDVCRELVELYQFKTFEYKKLATIYAKLSSLIADVSGNARPLAEYFRVTFYGAGFPQTLQNTTLVYRGKPFEKLDDFHKFILDKYPDCVLMKSLAEPNENELLDESVKMIQVNACTPQVDLRVKFGDAENLSSIDESILVYYKHNDCCKFTFSRRLRQPKLSSTSNSSDDNFASLWREKLTLQTEFAMPGLLPFCQVVCIDKSTVSPIENAIEDMKNANARLGFAVNTFKCEDKRQLADVRTLGQVLLGISDAAINGGIAKYEQAFFSQMHLSKDGTLASGKQATSSNLLAVPIQEPKLSLQRQQQLGNNKSHNSKTDDSQVTELKRLIAAQLPLLEEGLSLHATLIADIMRPQHEYLEDAIKKLKHHILTHYASFLPHEYRRRSSSMRTLRKSGIRADRHSSFTGTSNADTVVG